MFKRCLHCNKLVVFSQSKRSAGPLHTKCHVAKLISEIDKSQEQGVIFPPSGEFGKDQFNFLFGELKQVLGKS